MGKSAKTNFDSNLVLTYIRSGVPLEPALKAHPTLELILGPAKAVSRKGIPGVSFANNALDVDGKYLKVGIRKGASNMAQLSRANMSAARTGAAPDVADVAEVQTARAIIPYNLPLDFMEEGSSKYWEGSGSAETWLGDQIMEDYANTTGGYLFASGASYIPGDGKFGSLRTQITDGLTSGTRATSFGPDDSAYANFLNITRSSSYRSQTLNGASGAFTEKMGLTLALYMQKVGARQGEIFAPMSLPRYATFVDRLYSSYGKYELTAGERSMLGFPDVDAVKVNGVIYYPEPDMPEGQTWQLFLNKDSIVGGSNFRNATVRQAVDVNKNASDIFDTIFKHQLVVDKPWRCGIAYDLTAL